MWNDPRGKMRRSSRLWNGPRVKTRGKGRGYGMSPGGGQGHGVVQRGYIKGEDQDCGMVPKVI